jgi:hypothetical protein
MATSDSFPTNLDMESERGCRSVPLPAGLRSGDMVITGPPDVGTGFEWMG